MDDEKTTSDVTEILEPVNQEALEPEQERPESPDPSRSKKRLAVSLIALAVIILIAGSITVAVAQQAPAPGAAPTPSATTSNDADEKAKTAPVYIDMSAQGDASRAIDTATIEIILPATSEVVGKEATDKKIKDVELTPGTRTLAAELPEGNYEINLTAAPVEADGSTYTLPTTPIEFAVGKDGTAVIVTIDLVRVPVADMSKEQLAAVAAMVETRTGTEHEALIKDLTTKQETAPSVAGSDAGIQAPSKDPAASASTPSNDNTPTSTPGSTPPANSGGSSAPAPAPAPPTHTHSYQPVYGAAPYIIDVQAQDAVYGGRTYWLCGGIKWYDAQEMSDYSYEHKLSFSTRTEEYLISEAVAEQGHYGPAPLLYSQCACGAQS